MRTFQTLAFLALPQIVFAADEGIAAAAAGIEKTDADITNGEPLSVILREGAGSIDKLARLTPPQQRAVVDKLRADGDTDGAQGIAKLLDGAENGGPSLSEVAAGLRDNAEFADMLDGISAAVQDFDRD